MINTETVGRLELPWKGLLRWSAHLSAVMLFFIPVQIAVFTLFPPPETVEGFFRLYQSNWILGLLSLDFLYILNNIILIFIYIALSACLYKEMPVVSVVALILGLIGVACYFPTNPAFEMLSLSHAYWNASPDMHTQYLAAGQSLLVHYRGTAFDVYYVLNAVALLLYSKATIKSLHFSKATGIWGLASGVLMIIPSSAGMVGLVFSLLSLIPWIVFLLLLTIRFYRLSN